MKIKNENYNTLKEKIKKIQKKNKEWYVKLTNWEFWPFNVMYFPIFFYFGFLILKSKSLFFFTASNPGIEFGGMAGESKIKIYNIIPDKYLPKTKFFSKNNPDIILNKEILDFIKKENINYPFILKPNTGERGTDVKKIENENDVVEYIKSIKKDFILQEYVNYDLELAIFYHRFPNQENGKITSITRKKFLSVVGDGISNIKTLLKNDNRYQLYVEHIEKKYPEKINITPKDGEEFLVEPIGNHCRGTIFLNDNKMINKKLEESFDKICKDIKGFYFGRFDIRCKSYEDLENGKDFKILELNGAGAEPAHIYGPGISLWQAYRSIIYHLNILYKISKINHIKGVKYYSFKEGWNFIKNIKK